MKLKDLANIVEDFRLKHDGTKLKKSKYIIVGAAAAAVLA